MALRIISGDFRGRRLEAPEGEHTRPTTDRVREALMSAVESRIGGFDGKHVLDAFAGSGALALEALSRGASRAVMLEADSKALSCIRRNVEALGLSSAQARAVKADSLAFATGSIGLGGQPFDAIFLDPPYKTPPESVHSMLAGLDEAGLAASEAIATYEHASADDDAVDSAFAQGPFRLVKRRVYGKTSLDVYMLESI